MLQVSPISPLAHLQPVPPPSHPSPHNYLCPCIMHLHMQFMFVFLAFQLEVLLFQGTIHDGLFKNTLPPRVKIQPPSPPKPRKSSTVITATQHLALT